MKGLVEKVSEELEGGMKHKPMVSVTFDDGYYTQASIGARILGENGIRGTFFITSWQDGSRDVDGPETPAANDRMTERQIRELADQGHEVGCHSTTHTREPDPEVFRQEWLTSKKYLEGITNKPVIA